MESPTKNKNDALKLGKTSWLRYTAKFRMHLEGILMKFYRISKISMHEVFLRVLQNHTDIARQPTKT